MRELLQKFFKEEKSQKTNLRDMIKKTKLIFPDLKEWINQNCDSKIPKISKVKRFYSAVHDGFSFTCPHGYEIDLSESIELKFPKNMKNGACSCYEEYMKSDYVKHKKALAVQRQKDTCMRIYHTTSPTNNPEIREAMIEKCRRETGYDWPAQNPKIHQKSIDGCLKNNGCMYPLQNKDIMAKAEQTKLENAIPQEKINEKRENTSLKEYGVAHHAQLPKERENISKRMKEFWAKPESKIQQAATLSNTIQNHFNRKFPAQIQLSDETYKVLQTKELFATELSTLGLTGFTKKYKVGAMTVYRYHKIYKLNFFKTSIGSTEIEIESWLKSNNINFQARNRKVLGGKELDFYFKDQNFAIEFQGDFWHGSPNLFKDTDYHPIKKMTIQEIRNADELKAQQCKEKGIELMQIWESDWNENKDEIKKKILNRLEKK